MPDSKAAAWARAMRERLAGGQVLLPPRPAFHRPGFTADVTTLGGLSVRMAATDDDRLSVEKILTPLDARALGEFLRETFGEPQG